MRLGVKWHNNLLLKLQNFHMITACGELIILSAIAFELQRNNNMMIGVVLHPVSDSTIENFSQ